MRGTNSTSTRQRQRDQLEALEQQLFAIVRQIQRLKKELAPQRGVKKKAAAKRGARG